MRINRGNLTALAVGKFRVRIRKLLKICFYRAKWSCFADFTFSQAAIHCTEETAAVQLSLSFEQCLRISEVKLQLKTN